MLLLFFVFTPFTLHPQIETERTIWTAWTIEHSKEWEIIEQNDTTASYFRRNEYFESMDELIRRDYNWLQLCKYMQDQYPEKIFFPNLGFAIIRKADQELIGTLRIKFSNQSGAVSFGYGLRPEARNEKFGQEIMIAFSKYIDQLITHHAITLKQDKNIFMAEWYEQGKKEQPNFEHLASFFNPQPQQLEKMIGAVDGKNPASLVILMRNSWQPFSLECDKYIHRPDNRYISYDFLLQYPSNENNSCEKVEELAYDIISRNTIRIEDAYHHIIQLFHIDSSWKEVMFSRAEKAILQPVERTSSFYDCSTVIKGIISRTYYPPYCFIE